MIFSILVFVSLVVALLYVIFKYRHYTPSERSSFDECGTSFSVFDSTGDSGNGSDGGGFGGGESGGGGASSDF